MRITAAVTEEKGAPFLLRDLDLGEPRSDEVVVKIAASGMEGRFPVERIMTFYDFDQIEQAAHDAEAGHVISPCSA